LVGLGQAWSRAATQSTPYQPGTLSQNRPSEVLNTNPGGEEISDRGSRNRRRRASASGPLLGRPSLWIGSQPLLSHPNLARCLGSATRGSRVDPRDVANRIGLQNARPPQDIRGTVEADLKLVQDGPYAFSRNPIYLSFAPFYLGLSLIFDSLPALIMLCPVLIAVDRGRYGGRRVPGGRVQRRFSPIQIEGPPLGIEASDSPLSSSRGRRHP
jgi:hypothetical protein